MPPATNRTQRKRPGDLTGVRGQQLAAEAAANKAEATRQVAEAREVERQERINTDVDYSTPAQVIRQAVRKPVVKVVEVDGHEMTEVTGDTELVVEDIAIEAPTRRIRVNYPIDEMTFGREVLSQGEFDEYGVAIKPPILGNLRQYKFEEGRWYTVNADLAEHLAYLGYIYE